MRKNKLIKQRMEIHYGIRLRELCEIMNPPEYRRKDFCSGETITGIASSMGKPPSYVLNEIRLKHLKATIVDKKVRIKWSDYMDWLAHS